MATEAKPNRGKVRMQRDEGEKIKDGKLEVWVIGHIDRLSLHYLLFNV